MLPRLGDTEREALEAGTVWWDGELFRGAPEWQRLLDFRISKLSDAERAFLDGPMEEICRGRDDWDVFLRGDLPSAIWERLRSERFFGMIIPEAWGGLGSSAQAHSAVIMKLASRSVACAVTVMVPNSVGSAELLLHYGTEAQKHHYLPWLTRGEEIPCFALTGPEAGSDAAATQSEGVVCNGKWDDREVLGMRLRWRKRYITLAPVATLIGLAFRLRYSGTCSATERISGSPARSCPQPARDRDRRAPPTSDDGCRTREASCRACRNAACGRD
jgi:acyl-CoA dehydrogenase